MSSLLVVGAGGHGKVVADAAMLMKCWDSIAFADDDRGLRPAPFGLPVVGAVSECERIGKRFDAVAIGIGDNEIRASLFERLRANGLEMPVIVHPAACISPFSSVGAGTVVFAQAVINPGAVLGNACVLNTAATVDHDCQIADAVHISPGAHLAGNVSVGDRAWIGIGACVRQGLTIGARAMVGAGSVVVANVPAAATVYGVPAKVRR